jgi:hypothetical protein
MTQTKNAFALARGLSALAARLEAKDAKEPAAALAHAMTQTKNARALLALAEALSGVAARLGPKEASETCAQPAAALMLCMSMRNDWEALPELSKALAAGLSRESTERPMILMLLPVLWNPVLEPQPEPFPAETLVELLKHPLCVGQAPRIVLDQLGRHYGRRFENQWDFVHFAEEQKLGLDFTSPVQRR